MLGYVIQKQHRATYLATIKHNSSLSELESVWSVIPSEPRARALAYSKLCWKWIPFKDRPHFWYNALGATKRQKESSKSYDDFLAESEGLDPITLQQITKDVPRTFSDSHPRFTHGNATSVLSSLKRVLKAVVVARPGMQCVYTHTRTRTRTRIRTHAHAHVSIHYSMLIMQPC